MLLLFILFILFLPIQGSELCFFTEISKEILFLTLMKMYGRHTVGLRNCEYILSKYKYKKLNCTLRSFWVQNFEVSSSEERYFPLHIPNQPLLIAVLCLFLKIKLGRLSLKLEVFETYFPLYKEYMIIFSIYKNERIDIVNIHLVF